MSKRRPLVMSVSEFRRTDATELAKKLRRSGRPLGLTVNGEKRLVVLDIATYRETVERLNALEDADDVIALMQGMADVDAGRTRDAFEVLDELAAKYNLPIPKDG